MEKEGRPPIDSELHNSIHNIHTHDIDQLKKEAGIIAEPAQHTKALSGEREDEVFKFWIEEYLEEDWNNHSELEVNAKMDMRMQMNNISEAELDATVEKYGKWMDIEQYL